MSDYGWAFEALARGRHTHTFDVLTTVDGEPSGVVCSTCGHTWPVDEDRYLVATQRDSPHPTHDEDESFHG